METRESFKKWCEKNILSGRDAKFSEVLADCDIYRIHSHFEDAPREGKRKFEVWYGGNFIQVDNSFESIFEKRFIDIVDRSGSWIYFVGKQDDGEAFLYRLEAYSFNAPNEYEK